MLGPRELHLIAERRYSRMMTAIERAKLLGTYNLVDRSRQYQSASHGELVEQVNEAWAKIRRCEHELTKRDQVIDQLHNKLKIYRWKYTALVAVVTGLAWEGLRVIVPIALRWLGVI